jgi:hypothetical protein
MQALRWVGIGGGWGGGGGQKRMQSFVGSLLEDIRFGEVEGAGRVT